MPQDEAGVEFVVDARNHRYPFNRIVGYHQIVHV